MADLTKFFIFNISRGQIEGHERDKILYHWNKDAPNCKADLKTQIQDICLCDASINFCKQFDPSGTQQQMMLFNNSKLIMIEVEKDHWFGASVTRMTAKESPSVATAAVHSTSGSTNTSLASSSATLQPSTTTQQHKLTQSAETRRFDTNQNTDLPRSASASSLSNNNQQADSLSGTIDAVCDTPKNYDPDKLMSDQQNIVSDDSIVPNGIVEQLLTNIYKRFCLLNGAFCMLNDSVGYRDHEESFSTANEEPLKKLRTICARYFDQIMPAIKLHTMVANINLLYMHIQYLNLDCISLMKVNSFVSQILCLNSSVLTHSMVVFNNQLIWSTLTLDDTRVLYHYLISTVIRQALDEELSGDIDKVRRIRNEQRIYLSNNSLQNKKSESAIKHEEPNRANDHSPPLIMHYMTIFRSSNDMTLCLVHNKSDANLMDKCERFLLGDPRIGIIPLASLAQMVGQIFVKMNTRSGQGRSLSNFSSSNPSSLLNGGRGHINLVDDRKYAFLDHSNASYKSPIGLDPRKTMDGDSIIKNLKFSKHVLEFEMDAALLEVSCDCFIQEILGRTTSDNWLTASRTRSRKLYSMHHNRNASLVEAYQSATLMRKQFSDILF